MKLTKTLPKLALLTFVLPAQANGLLKAEALNNAALNQTAKLEISLSMDTLSNNKIDFSHNAELSLQKKAQQLAVQKSVIAMQTEEIAE